MHYNKMRRALRGADLRQALEVVDTKIDIMEAYDAMGTQKEIAEQIKKKRADYVLALKGNQGTLYADVKEYFGDKEFLKQMQEKGCYKKTREKARSQIETREYYQTDSIRLAGTKESLEGVEKHSHGEEDA